uniref:Desmoplakin n=1 Tax=Salmo trutta TaxID=8032 RepID=A0A673ZMQ7_SALTR
ISMYGSHNRLPTMSRRSNSRPDLTSGTQFVVGGNGYQQEYADGYSYSQTFSKTAMGGGGGGYGGGLGGGTRYVIQHKAFFLQSQCQEYLQRVQQILQAGGPAGEVDKLMIMSSEAIDQLKGCAMEVCSCVCVCLIHSFAYVFAFTFVLRNRWDESTLIFHSGITSSISGTTQRMSRGSIGWEERGRTYTDAMSWIGQQKRLIETSPWGEDAATIEQQILSQNKFHSSIQRSQEVERARDELVRTVELTVTRAQSSPWTGQIKMSFARMGQLRELQNIIEEISRAIMWVNEREEEELVFNWGDKNIDVYIPKKQESYSKLMSALEVKEKELNKLKQKVDGLLKNNHPASDKIEAYMDTLQTQWSWLLQITKCIHVHLKENAAYSQFFKEANEIYSKLQKEHENIRKKFTCDKGTSLENLTELLKNLEREKETIMENKRQVKNLVNKSKSIVRLRPRNPEEKSSSPSPVIVQALCDFKQDQKGIFKGDEGILTDNTQRSKWHVTGPGGLDMLIPSVCLLIPPPNPISIGLANKNEQYYEAIMGIWNQLYINIKSLISWQYCVKDINHINSLTLTMLSQMRPEEYRNIIKSLETHYQEFLRNSHGSEMFGEDEKKRMEGQYAGAQTHYDTLVIGLPTYTEVVKKEVVKLVVQHEPPIKVETTNILQGSTLSLTLLSDLHALRRRLELAESGLSHHLHVPLGENSVQECSQHLLKLEGIHHDLDGVRDEYLRLRERVLRQLEGTAADSEQAKFLRKELDLLNQKLGDLQGLSSAYLQRLSYLRNLCQSLLQAEDVIKVHEARLTEKETTSLDLNEVERYRSTLKQMKSELENKRDLLKAMESDLVNAVHVNSQISASFHKCDVDLSKYADLVGQMSDRWRRIQTQIDSRVWDLEKQEKQLRHFQQSSGVVDQWIDNAKQRQDTLQAAKFSDIQALMEHLNQQKVLHSEIKGKKEKVEDVQKDADTCATSIKDYELQLASYSAGLETLLNIPIKKTMLQSPATVVREEANDLQSRYIELLTRSSDYYKFLGEMLKNMEELKIRNTKIELLEEELRRLKDNIQDRSEKNRSLEDALSRYKLELSQSKEQLISMEEVKRTTAMQASVARESLDTTSSQLTELSDKLARLTYQLDEEKRKRRLAEERYTSQQEEYEAAVRRRQKELDEVNWSKIDLEKAVKDKDRELERLRMQLEEEATRRRGAEQDISKTSMMVQQSQNHYTEILSERDTLLIKLKQLEQDKTRQGRYEEELNRIKVSLETELRNKQRLQEERDKIHKDFTYWKSQYELKEGQMRQCDSDKDKMERERLSLKSDLERMMVELRTVEERHKGRLQSSQREVSDLALKRDSLERELRRLQQRPDSMSIQTQTDEKVVTKPMTVQGLRGEVSVTELINSNLLSETDVQKLNQGKLSSKEIEDKLKNYLHGSNCIAGIYDEANNRIMTIYQAMKEGLLRRGTTLELLEAQAASGFVIDPINNVCMNVEEAWKRGLVGKEFKDKLMSAEKAVTGYKDPHTGNTISLFQAIEKDLIEKGHGIRLLEAQIASGGIIDPKESHRIDVDIAYKRGYFDEEMNEILTYEGDDTKGFFDPNTQENLTYLQLKERCITDPKTGLVLLPLRDKTNPQQMVQQSSQKNILRKRRVVIVDPDTGKEMTVREAYHKELIDYDTFLNLSEQECEWEEITIRASDGSARMVVVDRKTGTQYDIQDSLDRGIIDQTSLEQYRLGTLTLTQFADLITSKSSLSELSITASNMEDVATCSSPTQACPSSPTVRKRFNSISITFSPTDEFDEGSPIAAIFDMETMEKITILEALRRGIVDAITAQKLLEAQACTGGIINPTNGQRLNLQDAVHQGLIDDDMATKLKPAQKAFMGFEDVKTKRKMSVVEAMKEKWLPYEAGTRFMEFQYLTGGLLEPGNGQKTSIEAAIRRGWLDGRGAQKLQDTRSHTKNLTCPKTKLKISYKEAMDSCMVEEGNGMKMLQASSMSSKGISSPYNVSNPGSRSGSRAGSLATSRSGSRSGSRRGSVDYSSSYSTFTTSASNTLSVNSKF